ncbi:MAG: decarboxylase [Nanobdellota archaeon]
MSRFLISKGTALHQHTKIKEIANHVSYSFKTNPHVGYILRDHTDCSFSIHSLKSLNLLNCPKRIIYFAQGWDYNELQEVYLRGVRDFVIDNPQDLQVLLDFDNPLNLTLRMRLKEHTVHTGKHFVFGFYSEKVRDLLPKLKAHPHVQKLGIHVHRKSQNISEWSIRSELESIFTDEHLEMIDSINIGGGIPSTYKNFRAEVLDKIFAKVSSLRQWLNDHDIHMIIEPGRYIAAPAVKLEAKILTVYDNNVIIDCSIYNGAMDTFVTNIRLLIEEEGEGEPYTIKGKTPDSIDIFRYKAYLTDPKPGETLTFLNAGAYTYATDFCGLEPILVEIID